MSNYQNEASNSAARAIIEARAQQNTFWRMLGIEVLDAGDGWVRLRLPLRDDLRNGPGAPLHGGALATLHESSAGGTGQASLDANVSFIGAVREGAAVVDGRIIRRGGTIAFGEAEVRDETGALAAKGRATYMILRPR